MSTDNEQLEKLRSQLRQVRLCALVIEEVNRDVTKPESVDDKADLLIAVENLAAEVFKLIEQSRSLVWDGVPAELPPDIIV